MLGGVAPILIVILSTRFKQMLINERHSFPDEDDVCKIPGLVWQQAKSKFVKMPFLVQKDLIMNVYFCD